MQFSRASQLTAKRLIIPGTVFVIYAQQAQCAQPQEDSLRQKLFTWGSKHKLDVFVKKTSRELTDILVDCSLSNELEAMVDATGAVFARERPDQPWERLGNFGKSGWFGAGPRATQVATSGGQLYVLDEKGDVHRRKGALFVHIPLPGPARAVAAAEDRAAVVTRKGRVFMAGTNEFGQCGLGDVLDTKGEFLQIPERHFASPVRQVALGSRHTLFRTKDGRVYSCGSNDSMQLGLQWTKEKCWLANRDWMEIGKLDAEDQIQALESQVDKRSFYDVKTLELTPRVCLGRCFNGYCSSIAAGEKHSVALIGKSARNTPELYTWGAGMRGQLGHRNVTSMCEPRNVSMIMQYDEFDEEKNAMVPCVPTQIACGADHTMVTIKGPQSTMVFAMGDNTESQISNIKTRKYTLPVWIKKISPMNGLNPLRIFAGGSRSAVLCEPTNPLLP